MQKTLLNSLLGISVLTLGISLAGCGRQCREARETVLEPSEKVIAYLQTNPSGQDLAANGCRQILGDLEYLPYGAKTVREIAERKFSYTNRTCLRWEESYRMRCVPYYYLGLSQALDEEGLEQLRHHPPRYRPPRYRRPPRRPPVYRPPRRHCYMERYTYCAQWQYDKVEEPGYRLAMELADNIEQTFDKAHDMCADAAAGKPDDAYTKSRSLLEYMVRDVKPNGDRVYAMACRNYD